MTQDQPPITPNPDYVAEFNRSAIFIWEFKDSIKRLVAALNRGPETDRGLPELINTLNQGRYSDEAIGKIKKLEGG